MPITTPIRVSTIRANAYSGLDDPSASTSIAEIATWLPVPGEARKTHATSIATTIASSTIQLGDPQQQAERDGDHHTGDHTDAALERLRQ